MYNTRPLTLVDSFEFTGDSGVEYQVTITLGDDYNFFYPYPHLECRQLILSSSNKDKFIGIDEEVGKTIAHGICNCVGKYPDSIFYYTCNDEGSEPLTRLFSKWFTKYKSGSMQLIEDNFEINGVSLYTGLIINEDLPLSVSIIGHFKDIKNQL